MVTFAPDQGEGGRDDEGGSGILKLFSVGSPMEKNPEQSLKRLASKGQSSSGWSLQSQGQMFSSYQSMSVEGGMKGPYRGFVDRELKKKTLSSLMKTVQKFIKPIQKLCATALTPTPCQIIKDIGNAPEELEKCPLLQAFLAPVEVSHMDAYHPREVAYERTTSVSALDWLQEFNSINLPHFRRQYIQLVHTPLDVMHECLKLQLGLDLPDTPSPLSVKQLVYECRDTLEEAIKVCKKYREVMEVITRDDHSMEQVDGDMEFFESDLNKVLMIYFNYLQEWVHVTSGHILEEEWRHVKQICSHIRSGEAEAGRQFCDMAAYLLDTTGSMFESRMGDHSHLVKLLHDTEGTVEKRNAASMELCKKFKKLFMEIQERSSKAIRIAKMLTKDLVIAADFAVDVEAQELMDVLKASDHTQVVIPNLTGKMVFVSEKMTDSVEDIQQLLSVSFAHSDPSVDLKESYMILVAMDTCMVEGQWTGKTLEMKTSAETTIAVSEMQIEGLKMIVASSAYVDSMRTSFLHDMGKAVTVTNEQTSIHRDVSTKIHDLKVAACKLAGQLIKAANHVEEQLGTGESCEKTYMAAMDTCFNLGFEYVRDVFRLVGEELAYRELGATILEYSQLWIRFVMYKCEHRLGEKPRWTSLGLEFIILACALRQLALMSRTNFLSLRQLMNLTLDYVNREAVVIEGKRSKFQASQYTLYDIHESEQYTDSLYGSQHRVYGAHTSDLHTAGLRHSLTPHLYSSLSYDTSENRSLSTPRRFSRSLSGGLALLSSGNEGDRLANIQKKIRLLELNREEQLCKSRIIGRVKSTQPSSHQPLKWQRGTKLGEGRFGKVYECRNLDTGEMIAVKQMSVQEKDSGTLQTIRDEIGIFQKVSHENIVQFHGLKVYHTELYVFMEYCHEGTLWTKAQQGLPEHMIRRYTRDLLRAVDMLHDRGIIHRDIKGSNIFLSKHSIKLGDCGLSVYLKKKTIQQQVGTIPYLSPEVVLEQEMGKPLDIWNVGCVVVEMATRKLPWSECDNQLKIVFQIGTGKSPPISRSALCDEGHEFLSHCFQASPNERWKAPHLLNHPFVKVSDVCED